MSIPADKLVNNFAIRSFRDIADGDYIAARMACRSQLVVQFLWSSQQAIEKYLKCILLLHRIPAKKVRHDLSAALKNIQSSGKLTLPLTHDTEKFIERLNAYGRFRYLEISNHAFGTEIVSLDRAVWELRRFCTLAQEPRQAVWLDGRPAPKVRIPGGELEKTIDDLKHPAREALLWQNGFFGKRSRRRVQPGRWMRASNSPLYLNPQILDEVLKYVFLPNDLVAAYRNHKKR